MKQVFLHYLSKHFKDEGIQHYITRGHAPFAQVVIITFKLQLYRRIEADEKNVDWSNHIFEKLLTCDKKMKHSTTELTPSEARKLQNDFKVRCIYQVKPSEKEVYPDLEVNDKVKLAKKKNYGETTNFVLVKRNIRRLKD